MNRDPSGEYADINLFSFVYQDGINQVDPNGLWGIWIGGFKIGVGDPSYVFDSEVWSEIKDSWHGGLDAVGTLDPTPVSDGLNATWYALEGDSGNAGISAAGMIPYVGDTAKAGKYLCKAAIERTKNIKKGIPDGKLGPSGKPKIHTVDHSSRKRAKDAARQDGKGQPIKHPSDTGQPPHFHAVEKNGKKIGAQSPHHNYPKSRR